MALIWGWQSCWLLVILLFGVWCVLVLVGLGLFVFCCICGVFLFLVLYFACGFVVLGGFVDVGVCVLGFCVFSLGVVVVLFWGLLDLVCTTLICLRCLCSLLCSLPLFISGGFVVLVVLRLCLFCFVWCEVFGFGLGVGLYPAAEVLLFLWFLGFVCLVDLWFFCFPL